MIHNGHINTKRIITLSIGTIKKLLILSSIFYIIISIAIFFSGSLTTRKQKTKYSYVNKNPYAKTFKLNKAHLKYTKRRIFLSNTVLIKSIYKQDTDRQPELNWSNLVVVLLTYDNYDATKLLQAQFATWINRTGEGLDIVIVTDVNDPRSDKELLFGLTNNGKFNIDIHRTSANNEKSRARHKVVESFYYVNKKYRNYNNKKYFLKIDPDSFIVADRLMNKLKDLHELTYPHPAHFGRISCSNNEVTCHVLGGMYGLSKGALDITLQYLSKNPDVYTKFIPNPTNTKENFMIHEDYFMSYAFWKATFYPKLYIRGISESQTITDDFISFHPVKNFREIYALHYLFYQGDNTIEGISIVQKKYLGVTAIMDFPKYQWNNNKLKFEIVSRYANKAY